MVQSLLDLEGRPTPAARRKAYTAIREIMADGVPRTGYELVDALRKRGIPMSESACTARLREIKDGTERVFKARFVDGRHVYVRVAA